MTLVCFRSYRLAAASLVTAGVFLLGGSSVAFAGILVGVGADPPPPSGPFVGSGLDNDMVMIGTLENPIHITVDESPTAPPWIKDIILNRDGIGWGSGGPTNMATIMEVITIDPSSTSTHGITDWHEDIDPTAGYGSLLKWAGGIIEILPGGPAFPGMVSADGKSIWFEFPPLPAPVTFKITKTLMWLGDTITPGPNGQNDYPLRISERPSIPEPSSIVLAGMALMGMIAWRVRR